MFSGIHKIHPTRIKQLCCTKNVYKCQGQVFRIYTMKNFYKRVNDKIINIFGKFSSDDSMWNFILPKSGLAFKYQTHFLVLISL